MPDNPNKPVLLNFRCPPVLLESFDRTCGAASKTRTEVLIDLMQRYTASASAAIDEARIEMPSNPGFKRLSRPIGHRGESGPLRTESLLQSRAYPRFSDWWFGRRQSA
jgi:hypothetical protein